MKSIQKNQFPLVIAALEKSAEQLENQNQQEAQKTIINISEQIEVLNNAAQTTELEYKKEQKKLTFALTEIIKKEGELRESSIETKKIIAELNEKITKEKTDEEELSKQIDSLEKILAKDNAELRKHQQKLDELYDTSVGSIFTSIASLGLDRAIMGISTLIEDDAGHIKSLNEEISRYKHQLTSYQDDINESELLLKQLEGKKHSSEKLIAELDKRAIELQKLEKDSRKKLAFFTKIALFYGKLLVLLQQADHRVDDVIDIVNELNDSTPTIIDFDSSGEDFISLKQALEKFDKFLDSEPLLEVKPV